MGFDDILEFFKNKTALSNRSTLYSNTTINDNNNFYCFSFIQSFSLVWRLLLDRWDIRNSFAWNKLLNYKYLNRLLNLHIYILFDLLKPYKILKIDFILVKLLEKRLTINSMPISIKFFLCYIELLSAVEFFDAWYYFPFLRKKLNNSITPNNKKWEKNFIEKNS